MKNTFFMVASASIVLAAAPSAFAGTLKLEALDYTNQGATGGGSSEFSLNYTAPLAGRFDYGVETTVNQNDNEGAVRSTFAAGVQSTVQAPFEFEITPRVELGGTFSAGNNFGFWGVETTATRNVYGPVSLTLGARYRQGFDTADLDETRYEVGLTYALNDKSALGLTYYNKNGITDSTAVGVSFNTKF
jgi:hypothetical protein